MSVVLTENAVRRNELYYRHCEEQSDEAIQFFPG
jgi:ribosomal protein L19